MYAMKYAEVQKLRGYIGRRAVPSAECHPNFLAQHVFGFKTHLNISVPALFRGSGRHTATPRNLHPSNNLPRLHPHFKLGFAIILNPPSTGYKHEHREVVGAGIQVQPSISYTRTLLHVAPKGAGDALMAGRFVLSNDEAKLCVAKLKVDICPGGSREYRISALTVWSCIPGPRESGEWLAENVKHNATYCIDTDEKFTAMQRYSVAKESAAR
ncbi:hypothetical protein ARMSODRAFT_983602 [Armillaria solidipes]|uniref:Uncharacterized protein n=1 Tax=Armillaria solidipes TaxID=1076256 RepID=A0A2H3AIH9_9AGAR|nr:hypothetical protein ARMSODRAFT_983602 [Armillaria solidipes]